MGHGLAALCSEVGVRSEAQPPNRSTCRGLVHPIVLFILTAIVAIFIFAKLKHTNATLETLEPLPVETTLLELAAPNVFAYREFGRATRWLNCKVRLSNKRIVIASKVLLQKSHVLSGVISWDEDAAGSSAPVERAIHTGSVQLTTERQSWSVEYESGKTFLVIPVQVQGADALVVPNSYKIETHEAGQLLALAQGL